MNIQNQTTTLQGGSIFLNYEKLKTPPTSIREVVVDTTLTNEPYSTPNVTAQPYYDDKINIFQNIAEIATGFKGWRLVRFLHNGRTDGFQSRDDLEGTDVYGDPNNWDSQWSVEFSSGGYDQYLFASGSLTVNELQRWLVLDKPQFEVVSSELANGYNVARTAVKSSLNPNSHTVNIATDNQTSRPLIGLDQWDLDEDVLYGEQSEPLFYAPTTTNSFRHYVFVRNSTDTQTVNPEPTHKTITLPSGSTYTINYPEETKIQVNNGTEQTITAGTNVVYQGGDEIKYSLETTTTADEEYQPSGYLKFNSDGTAGNWELEEEPPTYKDGLFEFPELFFQEFYTYLYLQQKAFVYYQYQLDGGQWTYIFRRTTITVQSNSIIKFRIKTTTLHAINAIDQFTRYFSLSVNDNRDGSPLVQDLQKEYDLIHTIDFNEAPYSQLLYDYSIFVRLQFNNIPNYNFYWNTIDFFIKRIDTTSGIIPVGGGGGGSTY